MRTTDYMMPGVAEADALLDDMTCPGTKGLCVHSLEPLGSRPSRKFPFHCPVYLSSTWRKAHQQSPQAGKHARREPLRKSVSGRDLANSERTDHEIHPVLRLVHRLCTLCSPMRPRKAGALAPLVPAQVQLAPLPSSDTSSPCEPISDCANAEPRC